MIKIVQCWDDGVVDDIRLCEILREHGARATFNLNPGLHSAQRAPSHRHRECKDVMRLARQELLPTYQGFTIANHSLNHPWPTKITAKEWRKTVIEGRKQLQDIFGQSIAGFAYPYGDASEEVAEIVREAGHTYARTCRNSTPSFPPANPMWFASDCHFAAPDFWDRYEKAKASSSPVFYFWGHSYELVTAEDWRNFAGKLDSFEGDQDAVWYDLPELFKPKASIAGD